MIPIRQKLSQDFISLKFRDYRFLIMGQFGSSMGLWMDQVARGWLIYDMTGSPLLLGVTGALKAVPLLFLGIFAGVIADRYGRKRQIIIAESANAALNLILAVLIVTHHVQVWHILFTGLLSGIAQAFHQPARVVLISDLVDNKHLNNAIGLNSVAFNISRTLGPSIAGITIALLNAGASYFIQTFIYLITVFFTTQINEPSRENKSNLSREKSKSFLDDMLEGFRYVKSDKLILILLVMALIPTLLGHPYLNLMPIFAKDILKVGPEGLGILMAFSGIGSIMGALFIATLAQGKAIGIYLISMEISFGIFLVLFALSPFMLLSLPILVIIGFSHTGYQVITNTSIQGHTPAQLRGRVMGVYFLDRGLMPLGTLLAGVMAGWIGAPHTVVILGASCAMLAIGVGFFVPALRRMR